MPAMVWVALVIIVLCMPSPTASSIFGTVAVTVLSPTGPLRSRSTSIRPTQPLEPQVQSYEKLPSRNPGEGSSLLPVGKPANRMRVS